MENINFENLLIKDWTGTVYENNIHTLLIGNNHQNRFICRH